MIELIVKNCNGDMVLYKYDSKTDFIFKFDTVGYENNIPMLDDEIVSLKIDNIKTNDSIIIVNDLYESFEKDIQNRDY